MTSPYTAEDLKNLRKALTSGAQSVSVQGRTVVFRSVSDLKTLLAEIEASLNADLPDSDPDKQPELKSVFAARFLRKISRW